MKHTNSAVEQSGGTLRRDTLNGKEYLVAPVVAVQEGVYLYPRQNGRGIKREFLNTEAIEESLPDWEGVPLTIPHPEDDKGRPGLIVNAETTHTDVGQFRNVSVDGDSLVGETWIREDAVGTVNGKLEEYIEAIESGEPQEVSTGYRANTEVEKGTYNNQRYTYQQDGLEPDHLALLPDERGNCSVEEGCGAGQVVNEMPFAGDDGARLNNRRMTVNATPEQVAIARDVAEQFVQSQGNASLGEFERWVRENESLGPNEQTAAMAIFDELFGQDPSEWGVESDFLTWLDQRAGEDRANTLGDISEPSGTLSVSEGPVGSDTESGLMADFLKRLNNLLEGKQPEGDSGTAIEEDDTGNMKDNKDRETLIEEIVTNSAYKEKSITGMGDKCLQHLHETEVVNSAAADGGDPADGDADGGSTDADDGGADDGGSDPDPTDAEIDSDISELRAQFEEQQKVIEDLKSEREEEREELEEQVNRRLIENTEISEENLDGMSLEAKQNLAEDLGATENAREEQTVNMNGIADHGVANSFGIDEDEAADSAIPAPGQSDYGAANEGEN